MIAEKKPLATDNTAAQTVVSGLPRNSYELPVPKKQAAPPAVFKVASVSYRVMFECGCSFERCLQGNFAPGVHITPCYKHRDDDEVAAAGAIAPCQSGVSFAAR